MILVEVGWGPPKSPLHVPGSIYLDTDRIERAQSAWKLAPDEELIAVFEEMGIDRNSEVQVYGDVLAASRAAHAMLYAGVSDARVIVPGVVPKNVLELGKQRKPVARSFGATRALRPELIASRDDVSSMIDDGGAVLADVRSLDEFEGKTSGYSYIAGAGRIPGAIWAKGGPHRNRVEEYTDDQGRFHALDRVRAMWREQGIVGEKRIAFYCGTSWRASIAYLFARAMGFPRIAVYDGGWLEWSSRRVPMTCDKREA